VLLRAPTIWTLCAGMLALAAPTYAQDPDPLATLSEVALPADIRGATAAIGDTLPPDRGQFLLEFIRRSHNLPFLGKVDTRIGPIRALASYLDGAVFIPSSENTLPLPLSPDFWTDVVFERRVTSGALLSAIVQSRDASLLYLGLLSLDDETRRWIGEHRQLIGDVLPHAAAFVAVAPGLRIVGSDLRLPGDDAARPIWEGLVGRPAKDVAGFIRALVTQGDGRMAYFVGAVSRLTPPQMRLAFELDSAEAGARLDAARHLYGVFERLAPGWKIAERAFQRPPLDPGLLISDLRIGADGAPRLPGTRRFWTAVFTDNAGRVRGERDDEARAVTEDRPVDFAWLCEQVFAGEPGDQRRRYYSVLYASRVLDRLTAENVRDAIEAVRAAIRYPALVIALERAQVADLGTIAAASRRAAQISSLSDDARMERALAQFQGIISLLTRAATRGSLSPETLTAWVTSLSAIEPNDRSGYDGSLIAWLDEHLRGLAPAPDGSPASVTDRALLTLVAGPALATPPIVDWEGTRYRVDLTKAEIFRIESLLGESPAPYLSSARTLKELADALASPTIAKDRLREYAAAFDRASRAAGLDIAEEWDEAEVRGRYRDTAATIERVAHDSDLQAASRLAPPLRLLADDLAARGLITLTYAVGMGQHDRAAISAGEAARRHDFGVRTVVGRRLAPWLPPVAGTGARGWRVQGALMNLEVALAEFLLLPMSSRPPTRRPSLNDDDRRVMTEAAAVFRSGLLTDQDRDRIVEAMQKGRARVAGIKLPAEAARLAEEMELSPMRRTLLPWIVKHDPARLVPFFSPSELFRLGSGDGAVAGRFDAWGVLAQPRLGCLCQQLLTRRPWEDFAGRWNSGILASGFPDLNLRLAELLAELHMPATLLGPVLWSASLDFINNVSSRDQDDHRALVEFVQTLRADRLELYLALLTTDGPLVPMVEGSGEPQTELAWR